MGEEGWEERGRGKEGERTGAVAAGGGRWRAVGGSGRAVAGCHMSQLATVSPYFQMMGLQRIDVAHLAVALQM